MLAAVLVGILAVLATAALIAVGVLYYRNHKDTSIGEKHSVASLSNIGVDPSVTGADGADAHLGDGNNLAAQGQTNSTRERGALIFAGAVFAALTLKAFWLQVVQGGKYARLADNNKFTVVYTPAPRGLIYDAFGVCLVKNRTSLTVLASAEVAEDRDILIRLSAVLGIPLNVLRLRCKNSNYASQAQRVIESDAKIRDVAFIVEHSDAFSGVSVETRVFREYPYGGLAAHLIGYTGTATQTDIDTADDGRDIQLGDDVGQSGVEARYDNILAGTHGVRKVITDANGNVLSVESDTQPTQGSNLFLTIDAQLQYYCDWSLRQLVAPEDNAIGSGTGTAAALVVYDVRDGSIKAMSSFPTYLPGEFVGGISIDTWSIYNSDAAHNPLMNRVISGTYPAASTFKAFSGLAGLRYGYATTEKVWDCTGEWDGWNSGDIQKCWDIYGHNDINFRTGVVESCDIVFYEIAKEFFDNRATIGYTALQEECQKFGFGNITGIDLAGEAYGRVPTPEWKAEYFKDVPEEASFRGGDLTNMAIGQGYILVTPLQLAVAYGSVATGKSMKPHLLKEVRNSSDTTVVSFKPEVLFEPEVDDEHYKIMRDALAGVAAENSTVSAIFREYGFKAAAKTGTAEVSGKGDFGWAVCYAPYDDPHYVVACVVEEGGGGGACAMPLAADVLDSALLAENGLFEFGVSQVEGSTGKVVEKKIESQGRTD